MIKKNNQQFQSFHKVNQFISTRKKIYSNKKSASKKMRFIIKKIALL